MRLARDVFLVRAGKTMVDGLAITESALLLFFKSAKCPCQHEIPARDNPHRRRALAAPPPPALSRGLIRVTK